MNIKAAVAALLLATTLAAPAAEPHYVADTSKLRKASTRVAFAKTSPCPLNGKAVVSCKGYVIDHIVPLCAGGLDQVDNMQWQTYQDSYKKDVLERAQCAKLKKAAK